MSYKTEKIRIIFYKADAPNATWLDKLRAWADGSDVSHCEVLRGVSSDGRSLYVEGCHAGSGGVTAGITARGDSQFGDYWRCYELYKPYSYMDDFVVGAKYDWLGSLKTKWSWWPSMSGRYTSSTHIAKRLRMLKHKEVGVAALEDYCRAKGRRVDLV